MTKELYEQVKDEIPSHIGVYLGGHCTKRPKKQELREDEKVLKDSLIRSLSREQEKLFMSNDENSVDSFRRQINRLKKERDVYSRQYRELEREIHEKYGYRWRKG